MSRVIYATDGSAAAAIGASQVAAIAWPPDTTICVLGVAPLLDSLLTATGGPLAGAGVGDAEGGEVAAAAAARSAADALRAAGLTAHTCIERGDPATVIADVARRESADLVVVGSRGRNAILGVLLGSVSLALTHDAPCPVLIARSPGLSRVLIADDGDQGATRAIDYLHGRPHLLGSSVRVIGVVTPAAAASETFDLPIHAGAAALMDDDRDDVVEDLRARLESTAAGFAGMQLSTTVLLHEGRPAAAIVDAAEAWPADLVVVGTRGRGAIASLILGSVSQHVLSHAQCSVLVVRPLAAPSPETSGRHAEAAAAR
jgi:nucleotide-binding universal stress UspA family protein